MTIRLACAAASFPLLAEAAVARDKDGLESCDSFLAKYETAHEGRRGRAKAQLDQSIARMRASWKQMTGTRKRSRRSSKAAS